MKPVSSPVKKTVFTTVKKQYHTTVIGSITAENSHDGLKKQIDIQNRRGYIAYFFDDQSLVVPLMNFRNITP